MMMLPLRTIPTPLLGAWVAPLPALTKPVLGILEMLPHGGNRPLDTDMPMLRSLTVAVADRIFVNGFLMPRLAVGKASGIESARRKVINQAPARNLRIAQPVKTVRLQVVNHDLFAIHGFTSTKMTLRWSLRKLAAHGGRFAQRRIRFRNAQP
jgi:hypothetical protein